MNVNAWMKATGTAVLLAGLIIMGVPQPASAASVPPAIKSVYQKNCKMCHGWDGQAQTPIGKRLKIRSWANAGFQKHVTDSAIVKAVLDGYKDPVTKRHMRGYKARVTKAQAEELVKVVRACAHGNPFPGEN